MATIRRKDTTKGPPLRILSLDGGGVRGYSLFIIIQDIMHRTYVEIEGKAPKRDQIPKPCDHFDLIIGTGTGGLIALMLGRLRLDLETCKEVYVRMTQKVFETDKTIAGIPYRSTLFKASKLEEAIKECVREHTIFQSEGNDGMETEAARSSPLNPRNTGPQRHTSNASVASFSAKSGGVYQNRGFLGRHGNPNALLYDNRENRTKTAVTAVYKGTGKGGSPVVLRSYDSRKEPAPEVNCKIWEAGRATSATGLAFKPIQIGQSLFLDEGAGRFNPSIEALDEACVNEWPGRDVGVMISIGTGKRPTGSEQNSHLWYEGFMGDFAEARRKLIAKIEGCEETHQYMVREGLSKRGVNVSNYYRFNVEIGVGEFGMNEWNRLSDISTNTRRYLSRVNPQQMVAESAVKLAKIHRAKLRYESDGEMSGVGGATSHHYKSLPDVPEAYPNAVELPADIPTNTPTITRMSPPPRPSYESGHIDNLAVPSPRTSSEHKIRPYSSGQNLTPVSPQSSMQSMNSIDGDKLQVHAPTPEQWHTASGNDKIAIVSADEISKPLPLVVQHINRVEPPPRPPKTPIQEPGSMMGRSRPMVLLPYPVDDGPPPAVNMAGKPKNWR
ncbi:hypothetical protein HYALB_00007362 [Hymenoscyphus albidus]|uniref:PNPLA domain-containing protein n=1 Tax=Hymenoscyphus albidus TaxID=595503 RepID=A0A9N9LKV1_9HELO|nr:hypothetical protein HYALB_00007362 [Hymenoscyphus albidus]